MSNSNLSPHANQLDRQVMDGMLCDLHARQEILNSLAFDKFDDKTEKVVLDAIGLVHDALIDMERYFYREAFGEDFDKSPERTTA
jgi:hypothetical protein